MAENDSSQEMTLIGGSNLSFKVALGAILAGLYGVFLLLPMSAFIGAGSIISFAICVAPLFGILFDYRWGFMFGLVAGIIGIIVSSAFGGLFIVLPNLVLGPALAGLFVGLSKQRTHKIGQVSVPGPIISALYLFTVIGIFVFMRPDAWWFIAGYMLAAISAVILQILPNTNLFNEEYITKWRIVPLALIGTFSDFSMMTLGSVFILDLPGFVFGFEIFPFMLIERTIAVVVSTILAIVVIKILKNYL